MSTLNLVLYILALVCFVIAAFGVVKASPAGLVRINFVALGLAFWVLTLVLSGLTIGTK